MKTKPCPRCGKTNPADVHTCTPKQDQSIDLNCPVGHEDLQGYLAGLRAENAKLACLLSIIGNPKKPMDGDAILEGFEATGFSGESFRLRCFNLGVRWAEEYHGIGGEYD